MFEAGIFTLSVLANDAQIDIIVPSLVAGYILDENDRSVDVKFLTERNVERLVSRSLNWRVENTYTL